MNDRDSAPNEGFPAATLADWRALAQRELRGGELEALTWNPIEGFALPPLAVASDVEALPHLASGAAGLLARHGPWAVRSRIDFAHPEQAAEAAARAVAHGADGIELRLDLYAQAGDQPELQDAEDDLLAGEFGLSAYGARDLEHVFDAVDLRRVVLAFDAGRAALPALAALLFHADDQGVGRSALRAELGIDPIGDAEPGTPARRQLDIAARVVSFCASRCRQIRPLVLDGERFHDGSAVEELAGVIAAGIALVRGLIERGLSIDTIAASTCLRLPVTTEPLLQAGKLRAARLLWAKVARAFGAGSAAALRLPVVAISSGRSLATEFDLRSNLIRTTLQAFAATAGGCDALLLAPWEPDPDYRRPNTLRLARAQQHLLREESRLALVPDPVAGAYSIERLTHEIAEGAWQLVREIEAAGGLLSPAGELLIHRRLQRTREARRQGHRRRVDTLVGINRYVDPRLEEERAPTIDRHELHASRCKALAEPRSDNRVRGALTDLEKALATPDGDIVEAAVAATAAGAAFVQIGDALFGLEEHDEAEPPTAVIADDAVPAGSFEDQRAAEMARHRPAALLTLGEPRQRGVRADFAADLFRAGGFEVGEPLTFDSPAAARQHVAALPAPAIAVLCCGDDQQAAALAALGDLEPQPILVAVGPRPADRAPLGVTFVTEGDDVLSALEYVSLRATLADESAVPTDPDERQRMHQERQRLETLLGIEVAER